MATALRTEKHRAKIRTVRKQTKRNVKDSDSRAHAPPKKPASLDDVLLYMMPDREWAEIPFTDADVPPAELSEAKSRAVRAMNEWGVMVEASRASRIGRHRLKNYMRTDEIFRQRMQHARKNCIERVEREMIRRGQLPKGELAAIFVMKHNIPRYREIQRVELTGKGGGPLLTADVKGELIKRLESIALKQKGSEAIAVGSRPKLLKGGSGDVEVHTIRKAKSDGFQAKSRK